MCATAGLDCNTHTCMNKHVHHTCGMLDCATRSCVQYMLWSVGYACCYLRNEDGSQACLRVLGLGLHIIRKCSGVRFILPSSTSLALALFKSACVSQYGTTSGRTHAHMQTTQHTEVRTGQLRGLQWPPWGCVAGSHQPRPPKAPHKPNKGHTLANTKHQQQVTCCYVAKGHRQIHSWRQHRIHAGPCPQPPQHCSVPQQSMHSTHWRCCSQRTH